jgi:hypothetical protein
VVEHVDRLVGAGAPKDSDQRVEADRKAKGVDEDEHGSIGISIEQGVDR